MISHYYYFHRLYLHWVRLFSHGASDRADMESIMTKE